MSENVLVTGVNGLLGRAVAAHLLERGQRITGMDVSNPEKDLGYTFVRADINDTHRLYSVMKDRAIDSIVHCGAVSGRVVQGDNPFMLLEINIRGTAQIFEVARKFEAKRVVFCSSSAAYGGDVPDLITEDTLLRPTTLYGASKASGEAIMRGYASDYGVNGIALRIFQVYGPRRTTPCYIREMITGSLRGSVTRLEHGKTSRRQYIYVDDVVDAIVLAWERRDLSRRVYNVAPDSSLTLEEVAQVVSGIVPGVRVAFGDDPEGRQYMIRGVDLSVAEKELGFFPKVTLEEGVRRYHRWLKEQAV